MEQQVIRMDLPPAFRLRSTALSHGWHECSPLNWSEGGECLQWIDRHGLDAVRVSMVELRAPQAARTLQVMVEGPASAIDVARHEQRVRNLLALDRNLDEFYALCATHPRLRIAPRIGAGRLIRGGSMTEDIVKFLCSTNVNWSQAVKMINRLAQLGPTVRHFASQHAWPVPREILRAGRSYLVEVCRVGYRADSILQFCREVEDGTRDPDAFVAMARDDSVPSDDIVRRLREIHGIGPASAHALLSLLGRYDRLSIDSATIAHAQRAHFDGRKPSPKEVERHYEPYGRWKNLVYWCENWLNWGTARRLVAELAGDEVPDHGTQSDKNTPARVTARRTRARSVRR